MFMKQLFKKKKKLSASSLLLAGLFYVLFYQWDVL